MINKFEYSDSQKLAILCAQSAQDKLAENTVVLGLEKIEIATSKFMVICDCKSTIQVKSVAENIINNILEHNLKKPRVEGLETSEWVILDFFDVVFHIFYNEIRDYYKLEKLWADSEFYFVNDDAELVETSYSAIKLEIENNNYED